MGKCKNALEVHINGILKQYIMSHATGLLLQPHSQVSPVIQLIRTYLKQHLLLCK